MSLEIWTTLLAQSFKEAKNAIYLSLSLSFLDFNEQFTLDCRSRCNIITGGQAEGVFPAPFLKLAAIMWVVNKLHVYLHGAEFNATDISDHKDFE